MTFGTNPVGFVGKIDVLHFDDEVQRPHPRKVEQMVHKKTKWYSNTVDGSEIPNNPLGYEISCQ